MRPRASKKARDNDGFQLRVPQDLPKAQSWRLWAKSKMRITRPMIEVIVAAQAKVVTRFAEHARELEELRRAS